MTPLKEDHYTAKVARKGKKLKVKKLKVKANFLKRCLTLILFVFLAIIAVRKAFFGNSSAYFDYSVYSAVKKDIEDHGINGIDGIYGRRSRRVFQKTHECY
jgi:hypothetical protein